MIDRLANMIKAHAAGLDRLSGEARFAVVSSVNVQTNSARVIIQPDGVLSGWLPILSPWVGNGWGMVCPPTPGDQVLLIPQEGDAEQGVIAGAAYSAGQIPPAAPSGEFWLVHQTGTSIKLCNDGTVRVNGDLYVQGDVYDHHGSLSGLRNSYNEHTHGLPNNGTTTTPTPVN